MHTIKVTISYDGTAYKGWQLQKNAKTIQEEMEDAVEKVFGKRHRLYGASRTDAGVHAIEQVAHFKAASAIPIHKIPRALNALLAEDIAIKKAEEMYPDFHARFDAKEKHYRYYIFNSKSRDPFKEKYSWRVPYRLDVPLMRREASILIGEHDFRSFQAKDKRERSSVRNIFYIDITKRKNSLIIDIAANGFLYNMVRNIVGTLVELARGYFPPGSMQKILKNKDRRTAGPTAPAKGLFLVEVKY